MREEKVNRFKISDYATAYHCQFSVFILLIRHYDLHAYLIFIKYLMQLLSNPRYTLVYLIMIMEYEMILHCLSSREITTNMK